MKVLVGGAYATGAGYPNGGVTIEILRHRLGADVIDCGTPLAGSTPLWKRVSSSPTGWLWLGFGLLAGNLWSLLRVLWHYRHGAALVYVRYPGLVFMALVSLLPRFLKPKCCLDAFISLWDSLYLDRGLIDRAGLVSRMLKVIERRGFNAAFRVLVDTEANRRFICSEFGVPPKRVVVLPLAVDETAWRQGKRARREDGICRVVFIGTLAPLHGIERIIEALVLLKDQPDIETILIGDGQQASLLEIACRQHPDLRIGWERRWLAPEELAQVVADADICLGVFGGTGKAARVLPYKLYLYLCAGKAIVSQYQLSVPEGLAHPPGCFVRTPSGETIAEAILTLARDPSKRDGLATAARAYYKEHLSNCAVAQHWRRLLETS